MHPFRAFITLYSNVSDEDWGKIIPCLEYKIFQQDRILHKQGTVCHSLYFLENGSIRFYATNEDEENSIHTVQPPSIFTAAESFSKLAPSKYSIQAVEESCVWVLNREDAHKLLDLPSWNNFLNKYFSKT